MVGLKWWFNISKLLVFMGEKEGFDGKNWD
jgi:hypothetical protein